MVENCHPVVSLEAGRGAVHAKTVVLGDLSSLELPGCMAQNDLGGEAVGEVLEQGVGVWAQTLVLALASLGHH